MGPGWRVGRVAGIELAIHPSWLVIGFLVTYSLAESLFPRQFRGWSSAEYWIVAGAAAALFFASVLAHELSHALVARRFGLKVEGITLFIFGGATSIDSDSRTPPEEGLISLAGRAEAGADTTRAGGGVRDAMDLEPPDVSPNESVADLVHERMLRGEDRSYLVRHDDGGLAGLVTLKDVRGLPREEWAGARVTDIMTRYADLAMIGPDEPLADALRLIEERQGGPLPALA